MLISRSASSVPFEDLVEWTKYSNQGVFRSGVIGPLDKQNLIDYDQDTNFVFISPLGKEVEETILKKVETTFA